MAAILVIKHGALGDVVMATGAMRAIRAHHQADRLTLLTTARYAPLLEGSGWFDAIWLDDRPTLARPQALWRLRGRLAGGGFARVYDLQTSERTALYFRIWPRPRPEWVGIAPGCSHPHTDPERDRLHGTDRLAGQLATVGIRDVPPPSLAFLDADLSAFALPPRVAVLVPGSSPHRPEKRWPAEHYAALAQLLHAAGLEPVLVGGPAEAGIIETIRRGCPAAIDLGGRTDLAQLAALGRHARLAVGNDTGPMHVLAAAPCPALTLFGAASEPRQCAPAGPASTWLREADLAALPVERVWDMLVARGLTGPDALAS